MFQVKGRWCYFLSWLYYTSWYAIGFITLALTIDRLRVILFPLQAHTGDQQAWEIKVCEVVVILCCMNRDHPDCYHSHPMSPSHPLRYPELGWSPLSCGMVGCCLIYYILANIGHKNRIRILNKSIYLFYTDLVILDIMVALISCSLSKVTPKAAENNGLITVISPLLAVPWPEWGMGCADDGYHRKHQLGDVIRLMGCSSYARYQRPSD